MYHGNNLQADTAKITCCFPPPYANCGLTIALKQSQQAQAVYPQEPTTALSLHTPLQRVAQEASSHGIRLYVSNITTQAPPPFPVERIDLSTMVVVRVGKIPQDTPLSWLAEVFRYCIGSAGEDQYISFGAQEPKQGWASLTTSQAAARAIYELFNRLIVDPKNLQIGLLQDKPTHIETARIKDLLIRETGVDTRRVLAIE